MSFRRSFFLWFFIGLTPLASRAQDVMSLQQCITYALEHNTQILKSQFDLEQQGNNLLKTKAMTLPSINGSASQNYNFGRTIDPSTNQFANQQSRNNYFSLNTDLVIFNGLQKMNEIRQAQWIKNGSVYGLQKMKDDISLTIANEYLQVLLLTERQQQLKNILANSTSQQEKTRILFKAGSATETTMLMADAQVASDEAALVDLENQLTKAYLALKQTMNYDLTKNFIVQAVDVSADLPGYSESDLTKALNDRVKVQPLVMQSQATVQSLFYAYRAMQGNMSPRLSANASIHSIYSSLAKNYSIRYDGVSTIGFLADSTPVFAPKFSPVTSPMSFNDQLKNNFGQSLGFTLSVPIFNGLQTRYAIQSSRISYRNAGLLLTDVENKTRNDIIQSFEAMQMAKKKYDAAAAKYKAQESLYNLSKKQFEQGVTGYFDWNIIQSNFSNSEIDLLQSKYEYVFQTKIFEFYLGKPVTL